ncbi:Uncharacterized protein PBTT_05695 [Plasmodiophora brassicae]|uniref:Uncharacterized protein n=1 Tax=Plasmodiophora brassicae TaxID=37360 RepID=A0A0G4IPG5_PLABS|nr:secrectory protein [Plasmodiophora brassicae]CEO97203.1 hypothetical protein PBRA_000548 [Plasmodiophora brassicae]SPQ97519.1 unnamed protein product [Plasmodiophora brassicae]
MSLSTWVVAAAAIVAVAVVGAVKSDDLTVEEQVVTAAEKDRVVETGHVLGNKDDTADETRVTKTEFIAAIAPLNLHRVKEEDKLRLKKQGTELLDIKSGDVEQIQIHQCLKAVMVAANELVADSGNLGKLEVVNDKIKVVDDLYKARASVSKGSSVYYKPGASLVAASALTGTLAGYALGTYRDTIGNWVRSTNWNPAGLEGQLMPAPNKAVVDKKVIRGLSTAAALAVMLVAAQNGLLGKTVQDKSNAMARNVKDAAADAMDRAHGKKRVHKKEVTVESSAAVSAVSATAVLGIVAIASLV